MAEDIGALEFRIVCNMTQLASAEARLTELRDKFSTPVEMEIVAGYSSLGDAMDQIDAMSRRMDDYNLELRLKLNPGDLDVVQATLAGLKAKWEASPIMLRTQVQGDGAWIAPPTAPPGPGAGPALAAPAPQASPSGLAPLTAAPEQAGKKRGNWLLGGSFMKHYWSWNFGAMVAGRAMTGIAHVIQADRQYVHGQHVAGANASLGDSIELGAQQKWISAWRSIPIAGPVAYGVADIVASHFGFGPDGARQAAAARWQITQRSMAGRLGARVVQAQAAGRMAAVSGNIRLGLADTHAQLRAAYNSQVYAVRSAAAKEQALAESAGAAHMIQRQVRDQLSALRSAYAANVAAANASAFAQQQVRVALEQDALSARRFGRAGEQGLAAGAAAREKILMLDHLYAQSHNTAYQARAIAAAAALQSREQAYVIGTRQMAVQAMPDQSHAQIAARLHAQESLALGLAARTGLTRGEIAKRQAVVRREYAARIAAAAASESPAARKREESAAHAASSAREEARRRRAGAITMGTLREQLREALSPDSAAQARARFEERSAIDRLTRDASLTPAQRAGAIAMERQIYAAKMAGASARYAKVADPGAVMGEIAAPARHLSAAESSARTLKKIAADLGRLVEGTAAGAGLFNVGSG